MKKRILIYGQADSLWMKRYVEHILLGTPYELTIVSDSNVKFADFYLQHGIHVFAEFSTDTPQLFLRRKIGSVRKLIFSLSQGHFDVIHVHSVVPSCLETALITADRETKVICSFWGSDLLRASKKDIDRIRRCLSRVDRITLESSYMYQRFVAEFDHGYDDKIVQVLFGVSSFSDIDRLRTDYLSLQKYREEMEIPNGKIVIAIGGNAYPQQQHLKVINCIANLPAETRERIHLVFQMTYGLLQDGSYVESVQQAALDTGCTYTVLKKFMSDETVAALRLLVDVFVHAQTTDSFGACIQEYLYSGTRVLNPDWIHYDELEKAGVAYDSYSNWEELSLLLKTVLTNWNDTRTCLTQKNRAILYNMESWESVKKTWIDLYAGGRVHES